MTRSIPSLFPVVPELTAVSSSFLEIVQLPNGEIVLQRSSGDRADEEESRAEPLVNIRFSEESRDYIGDAHLDIAKVMIQAGIQAAAHFNFTGEKGEDLLSKDDPNGEAPTLH